ncbi:hypothetical protein ACLKA7_013943 [Drosophila subpalustris]
MVETDASKRLRSMRANKTSNSNNSNKKKNNNKNCLQCWLAYVEQAANWLIMSQKLITAITSYAWHLVEAAMAQVSYPVLPVFARGLWGHGQGPGKDAAAAVAPHGT